VELLLRVTRIGAATRDVRVSVEAHHTVRDVVEALGAPGPTLPPVTVARSGLVVEPDASVVEAGIVSGDELVVGSFGHETAATPIPARAVSFDVLSGRHAGRAAALTEGVYTVGADSSCDFTLDDRDVAQRHLRIEVSSDFASTISAIDSDARITVNGEPITEPTVVGDGDVVGMGDATVSLRSFVRFDSSQRDLLGQIPFNRTPHRPVVVRDRELERISGIPSAPEPRRFAVLAALLPLGAGMTMFAFTRQPQFLILTLLSPLALFGNWFEDRKGNKQRFARQVGRFRAQLLDRRAQIADALRVERAERVASSPDAVGLARRAELRTVDLWPRRRDDAHVLRVRVGLGDVSSRVTVRVDAQGEDDLRDEATRAVDGHDHLAAVPIDLHLGQLGCAAIMGPPSTADAVARALVMQVLCLHSPEDVVFMAAVPQGRGFVEWLKWVPHTRAATSPIAGAHVAATTDDSARLLRALAELAESRASHNDRVDRRWPWVLALLDETMVDDRAVLSRLLERCPEAGISVVWIGATEGLVPRQAAATVRCPVDGSGAATISFTDPEIDACEVRLETMTASTCDRVGRALAPLRDATATTATSAIPRLVPILSLFGVDEPTPEWIAMQWSTDRGYSLAAPIGMGVDGPVVLDLVEHGPHGLIAGTSGAGKSELLQSFVASLVAHHSPERLNLLFVDYKGGASSTVFKPVPHTVGYVTNLDAALSMRALVSLRAELNRRMHLLEGRAKDIEEMLRLHPHDAPPSLVIIVDEFATLVKEVPDFVAGMVDIAQRGRSLGIHLLLATQRPTGSVNDNILANTNLRIALRLLDSMESTSIIGSPLASSIPMPLKGRAFGRFGSGDAIPFQAAFTGAPSGGAHAVSAVSVAPFTFDENDDRRHSVTRADDAPARPTTEGTQLDLVVDAVVAAAAAMPSLRPPRAPWCEMLPDHLSLDALPRIDGHDRRVRVGRDVVFGLVDDPRAQSQHPAIVDLEEGGGLLVVGSGGSGRTTLLRSIAASIARDAAPDEVVVYGLDFASRSLRTLDVLPHVATVATGDDLEAATRVLSLLARELDARRTELASMHAETLSAALAAGASMARIVVLIDGYQNLVSTFAAPHGDRSSLGEWIEVLHRVITEGRQVGIHLVLTADRRASIPGVVMSSIAHRIVLRQADENGYSDFGIPLAVAKGLDLEPGRALWHEQLVTQIACVATSGDARAQNEAIERIAASVDATLPSRYVTEPLPLQVDERPVALGPDVAWLGVADLTGADVTVDIARSPLCILGPSGSGRSTALRTVADSLAANGSDVTVIGGPLSGVTVARDDVRLVRGRAAELVPVLEELVVLGESFGAERTARALLVDDVDALDDPAVHAGLEAVMKQGSTRIVAAMESHSMTGYTPNPLVNEMRRTRRRLFLQPDSGAEIMNRFGIRVLLRPGLSMPPGRGVLLRDRSATVVQVAGATAT
jgi:DNA segregation ATPase FtsK/SpoIIIE, S-DNA-T family